MKAGFLPYHEVFPRIVNQIVLSRENNDLGVLKGARQLLAKNVDFLVEILIVTVSDYQVLKLFVA